MQTKLTRLTLSVSTALLSFSSLAQETPDVGEAGDKIMPAIEVIRVIGDSTSALLKQTGSVVIINQDQIDKIQPLSTQDVLRSIPGEY